jgi:hypothetical protein
MVPQNFRTFRKKYGKSGKTRKKFGSRDNGFWEN